MFSKGKIILLFCFFSFGSFSFSQQLNGFVFDENRNPLLGVNIFIINSNIGTTTNADGFFSLKLKEKKQSIVFSYIGFNSDTLIIKISDKSAIEREIILEQSSIELGQVIVFSDDYNSAEKIILQTIKNKNNYLRKIQNYTYDAYTKTVLLVPTSDTLRYGGILQTLSKGYYEYPDKFQEVILKKQQTKNISEVHNIFSIGKIPNILDETLLFDEDKIISPLNRNALDYYSYNIIDTTFLGKRKVFNIEFIPKNDTYQLFSGKVSIVEALFAVVSVELYGKDDIVTSIRKNIVVKQNFRQYENSFWLPISVSYNSEISMGLPGIPSIYFHQTSLISDYKINLPNFSYKFDKYLLRQSIDISNKSDTLWLTKQTIPLTKEEISATRHIDSIVTNASFLKKLVLGTTQLLTGINSVPITSFNDFYHFNRVEGNYVGFGIDTKKHLEAFNAKIKVGYGISDQKLKYSADISYALFNSSFIPFVEIFKRLSKVDRFYEYHDFDITYQTIFYKNDYADYFYTEGFNFGFSTSFNEYFSSTITFVSEEQENSQNNTSWSLFYKEQQYRSPFLIDEGKTNIISLALEYNDAKYYDLGFTKVPSNSDNFSNILFKYNYSSKSINSDFSFHQFYLSLNRSQKFPPYFTLNLSLKSGLLIGEKLSQLKFHLPGNYGTFAHSSLFRTIPNDQFLNDKYISLFIENNFKNTIFNVLQVPFLKKEKYDLFIFFNWALFEYDEQLQRNFIQRKREKYYEVGFGIGNILSLFRIDLAWRLSKQNTDDFNISILSNF